MDGDVAEGFGPVVDAFSANFADAGEIGAGLAVYRGADLVVDLAHGRDPILDRPFTRDTLMVVASCTKGAVATCVAMLMEADLLDPDEPVATYWPEFAQGGKQDVTVAMLLSHQAGLPYPDPGSGLTGLDQLTGPRLLAQLERQSPWWPPGTAFAYHPVTYGALAGELVRRVTGVTIGAWFADHVARPLGLDFWIGLPPQLDSRVAPGVWPAGGGAFETEPREHPDPGSYAARRLAAIAEMPPTEPDAHDAADRRRYFGAEIPAAYGITNARSLARMYAATLGDVDGVRLLSPAARTRATTPRTDGLPALVESGTAGPDIRFGLGYQLSSPSMPGLSPASFGHTGAGGRLAIADPDLGLAFGYVCNSMRNIPQGGDPRWRPLLDAVRACR